MKQFIPITDEKSLEIGQKVYYTDAQGEGFGAVHAFATDRDREFFIKYDGVTSVSIRTSYNQRPRYIPLNQLFLHQSP